MILITIITFTLGSLSTTTISPTTYLQIASLGIFISLLLLASHPIEVPVDLSLFNGLCHQSSIIMGSTFIYLLVALLALQLFNHPKDTDYTQFNKVQIALFALLGGLLLMSVFDLITLIIAIETQSFALYILASIHKNHSSSTYAGLKYFFLGGLASLLIMTGAVMIYSVTGDTSIDTISAILSNANSDVAFSLYLGLACLATGLFFKVGVAPLHAWSIDVYQAVPTTMTIWLAIVPKIALITLIYVIIAPLSFLAVPLTVTAGLSLLIGGLGGLVQDNIKRLLAYSTVAHLGFLFITMMEGGSEFFYLTGYSLMSLNTFCILVLLGSGILSSQSLGSVYSPVTRLSQLSLLYHRYPWLSIALAISLLSLGGIPPFLGFFTKMSALTTALFNNMWLLALLGVISSLLSITYYLRVIALMVFDLDRSSPQGHPVAVIKSTEEMGSLAIISSFIVAVLTSIIIVYPVAAAPYLSYTSVLSG